MNSGTIDTIKNAVFWFLFLSLMSSAGSKKTALIMIKRIGSNSKYYPDGFWKPARWMKKRYKFQERMIPWFSYCELLASNLFLALGPINIILSLIFSESTRITGILIMIQVSLALIVCVISTVCYVLFKNQSK